MEALPAPVILIVDDEHANRESLERVFVREDFQVLTADSGEAALDILRKREVSVVLADLMMPKMSGLDLLRAVRHIQPDCDVIMITAYGTVEIAVEAMKEGAYDFITKPIKRVAVVKAVRRAIERQALLSENRDLRARLREHEQSRRIIGRSEAMTRLLTNVRQAADSSATVLLSGESGTGKELLAREIHELSGREGPFVAVNMGALPEGIIESELFGHEKGAFTGAHAAHAGRFERAHRGTILLDEIGEAPPQVQVKLLRVLQESEIERVGGSAPLRVDVRVVAATHIDLKQAVEAGRFRDDLFYRLNVIAIRIPPLRERSEDIPLLAEFFAAKHAERTNRAVRGISRETLDVLLRYDWPGNVRELENIIERAVVLAKGDVITPEDLPETLHNEVPRPAGGTLTVPIGTTLEAIELQVIKETLRQVGGDKALAARLLGIAQRTIYRKLGEG